MSIHIVHGTDIDHMTRTLLQAADATSRIPSQTSKIVLKPNLVVAVTPDTGATTHPQILVSIIRYLQERGYSNITIAESAWIGDSTQRGFSVNGYHAISQELGVPLVDIKQDQYVQVSRGGFTFEVSKTIMECDFLISVPVLKGHCQTVMTCALKNMKGCLSDSSKRKFHTWGLHRPIAALNAVRHADLVVVDSICGDLDFEEGGNPVQQDRMFIGTDSVLLDSFGCKLMRIPTTDVPYIGYAQDMGVGSATLEAATIVDLDQAMRPSPALSQGKVQSLRKYVQEDHACSACVANLYGALDALDKEGKLQRLGECRFSIGQGYKGTSVAAPNVGIGSCACGHGHGVGGCPPTQAAILEYLHSLA